MKSEKLALPTTPSESSEADNDPPAAAPNMARSAAPATFARRFGQAVQRLPRPDARIWRLLAVALVLILLFVWVLTPSAPKPPPPPPAPLPPLLQPHHQWALGVLLLFLVAGGMSLHIGTLTLSGQTLTHRRNVVLGGVLLVLAELFNVDALKALSVDPHKIPLKPDGTLFRREELVYGVLALFIVFSYIEYLYNFIADYIKARLEFRKNQKDNPLVLMSFRGVGQLFVGAGRILFDVLLPVMVVSFAALLYHREAVAVVGVVKAFVAQKLDRVQAEVPQIRNYVEQAAEAASSAQDGVLRTIEDIKQPAPPQQ